MNEEKLYGIKQEVQGLKNAINELQTVVSEIGADMALLQRQMAGIQIATNINGARTFINHITKKGNTKERRIKK